MYFLSCMEIKTTIYYNQRMTMDWFLQYVNEVNQGDAGTVPLMVHILCANTFLLLLGK